MFIFLSLWRGEQSSADPETASLVQAAVAGVANGTNRTSVAAAIMNAARRSFAAAFPKPDQGVEFLLAPLVLGRNVAAAHRQKETC